jgi:archaeosortase C (PEF-CTERM variant)
MPPGTTNLEKLQILIALIVLFEGLNIALLSHELTKISPYTRIIGWVMLIGGIYYFINLYQKKARTKQIEQDKVEMKSIIVAGKVSRRRKPRPIKDEEPEANILTKLMSSIDSQAKNIFPYLLPIIGALIIDAVIIRNIMRGTEIDMGSFDLITILFGVTLIAYNYVPREFSLARDFAVFFFGIMFFVWIFPQMLGSLVAEKAYAEYTSILLAQPTGSILSMIGMSNEVSGDVLTFQLNDDSWASVGIGQACSGLYTATIFVALFVTFVLIEYKKVDMKVVILLALGIILVYFANILRMVTLVLVYHHYGFDSFSWAHANLGTIIFITWLTPFMYLLYRFLMREDMVEEVDEEEPKTKRSRA